LRIIGIVGMPGSGKTEASEVARSMGLAVVVMGDVIRQEAARLGLEPTDENLGMVGNTLRAREGPGAVARRCLEGMEALGRELVVVDGLRSKDEVDLFRANSEEFHLIEIRASWESRADRVALRGRSDDSDGGHGEIAGASRNSHKQTAEALERRASRETGWGIYEAIQEADLRISNDGSLVEFRRGVRDLLGKFLPA
jgi:dephospho-CoA kinase